MGVIHVGSEGTQNFLALLNSCYFLPVNNENGGMGKKKKLLSCEEENMFHFLVLVLGMLGESQFMFLSTASVIQSTLVFISSQVKQDLRGSEGDWWGAQPFLWPESGRTCKHEHPDQKAMLFLTWAPARS